MGTYWIVFLGVLSVVMPATVALTTAIMIKRKGSVSLSAKLLATTWILGTPFAIAYVVTLVVSPLRGTEFGSREGLFFGGLVMANLGIQVVAAAVMYGAFKPNKTKTSLHP